MRADGSPCSQGAGGHRAGVTQLPPRRTMALPLRVARRGAFTLKLFPDIQPHRVSRCAALCHQPPHHETERQQPQKPLVPTRSLAPYKGQPRPDPTAPIRVPCFENLLSGTIWDVVRQSGCFHSPCLRDGHGSGAMGGDDRLSAILSRDGPQLLHAGIWVTPHLSSCRKSCYEYSVFDPW